MSRERAQPPAQEELRGLRPVAALAEQAHMPDDMFDATTGVAVASGPENGLQRQHGVASMQGRFWPAPRSHDSSPPRLARQTGFARGRRETFRRRGQTIGSGRGRRRVRLRAGPRRSINGANLLELRQAYGWKGLAMPNRYVSKAEALGRQGAQKAADAMNVLGKPPAALRKL